MIETLRDGETIMDRAKELREAPVAFYLFGGCPSSLTGRSLLLVWFGVFVFASLYTYNIL